MVVKRLSSEKIGIRIVFKVIGGQVEIAEIISIGKRRNDEVYKGAAKRLRNIKKKHQ